MANRIEHNADQSRFEIYVDDALAGYADYVEAHGVRDFGHTVTEPDFRGQGIAGQVATMRAVSSDARATHVREFYLGDVEARLAGERRLYRFYTYGDDAALFLLDARSFRDTELAPVADPTDPASWTRSAQPVFAQSAANGVYAPGHNGFFKSPDGKQDWIIYHANAGPNWKCDKRRSPRIQRFHWRSDGAPDFGVPVKTGVPQAAPSR